ncbi:hypothetical protein SNEBB_010657 [Seison nebaliae]|nr:hypothetical protein SNEBB_010657 [Seison nebaliae]
MKNNEVIDAILNLLNIYESISLHKILNGQNNNFTDKDQLEVHEIPKKYLLNKLLVPLTSNQNVEETISIDQSLCNYNENSTTQNESPVNLRNNIKSYCNFINKCCNFDKYRNEYWEKNDNNELIDFIITIQINDNELMLGTVQLFLIFKFPHLLRTACRFIKRTNSKSYVNFLNTNLLVYLLDEYGQVLEETDLKQFNESLILNKFNNNSFYFGETEDNLIKFFILHEVFSSTLICRTLELTSKLFVNEIDRIKMKINEYLERLNNVNELSTNFFQFNDLYENYKIYYEQKKNTLTNSIDSWQYVDDTLIILFNGDEDDELDIPVDHSLNSERKNKKKEKFHVISSICTNSHLLSINSRYLKRLIDHQRCDRTKYYKLRNRQILIFDNGHQMSDFEKHCRYRILLNANSVSPKYFQLLISLLTTNHIDYSLLNNGFELPERYKNFISIHNQIMIDHANNNELSSSLILLRDLFALYNEGNLLEFEQIENKICYHILSYIFSNDSLLNQSPLKQLYYVKELELIDEHQFNKLNNFFKFNSVYQYNLFENFIKNYGNATKNKSYKLTELWKISWIISSRHKDEYKNSQSSQQDEEDEENDYFGYTICEPIKQFLLTYLSCNLNLILYSPDMYWVSIYLEIFLQLTPMQLHQILNDQFINCTERQLYVASVRWCEHQRRTKTPDLIETSQITLSHLTSSFKSFIQDKLKLQQMIERQLQRLEVKYTKNFLPESTGNEKKVYELHKLLHNLNTSTFNLRRSNTLTYHQQRSLTFSRTLFSTPKLSLFDLKFHRQEKSSGKHANFDNFMEKIKNYTDSDEASDFEEESSSNSNEIHTMLRDDDHVHGEIEEDSDYDDDHDDYGIDVQCNYYYKRYLSKYFHANKKNFAYVYLKAKHEKIELKRRDLMNKWKEYEKMKKNFIVEIVEIFQKNRLHHFFNKIPFHHTQSHHHRHHGNNSNFDSLIYNDNHMKCHYPSLFDQIEKERQVISKAFNNNNNNNNNNELNKLKHPPLPPPSTIVQRTVKKKTSSSAPSSPIQKERKKWNRRWHRSKKFELSSNHPIITHDCTSQSKRLLFQQEKNVKLLLNVGEYEHEIELCTGIIDEALKNGDSSTGRCIRIFPQFLTNFYKQVNNETYEKRTEI